MQKLEFTPAQTKEIKQFIWLHRGNPGEAGDELDEILKRILFEGCGTCNQFFWSMFSLETELKNLHAFRDKLSNQERSWCGRALSQKALELSDSVLNKKQQLVIHVRSNKCKAVACKVSDPKQFKQILRSGQMDSTIRQKIEETIWTQVVGELRRGSILAEWETMVSSSPAMNASEVQIPDSAMFPMELDDNSAREFVHWDHAYPEEKSSPFSLPPSPDCTLTQAEVQQIWEDFHVDLSSCDGTSEIGFSTNPGFDQP